jgi:hypothetical protein
MEASEMAAVIRIRLIDLLKILCEPLPKEVRTKSNSPSRAKLVVVEKRVEVAPRKYSASQDKPKTCEMWANSIDERELEAISQCLQYAGPAKRWDLQLGLNMSEKAILHRLDLLKERGVVEDLPGYRYGLKGA